MSSAGLVSSGRATRRRSRVQGKFSIHDAWQAFVSTARTSAIVRGAAHQLWNLMRISGWSMPYSIASAAAGWLPPWPLTISTRRKPARRMPSSSSRTTRT